MKRVGWVLLGWLSLTISVQAASFDCARANTKIEKMVCDDPELSKLDSDTSAVFKKMLGESENKPQDIRIQRQWLKEVRNSCKDKKCLKTAYQGRLEELSKVQVQEVAIKPESGPYVVRCDKRNQLLIISESRLMPEIEGSNSITDVSDFAIDPESLTKIIGTDMDSFRTPVSQRHYQCQLGSILYSITIKPHIQNAKINGECGAVDPDISLSVSRNKQKIFSELEFQRCRGNDSGKSINRVQFLEATHTIKVLSVPNVYFLPVSIEKTFSLSALPLDWNKAIFEDSLIGDGNAALFIAVNKRDIAAINQALHNGANPNSRDNDGFPPLALLNNGRYEADRDHRLDEFNHLSEEMAKILFAAGATGNAVNHNGVTLLDYLILNRATDPVIDMLLANGANVKDGTPIANAAVRANLYLIRKFLDGGADPNQQARDGTTALWTAATSGLYMSYGKVWDAPPITEYAKCIHLLLQHGARIEDAIPDSSGILWTLVNNFGKDEQLEILLSEFIPYAQRDDIERAQQRAERSSYPIAHWLKEQLH